MSNVENRVEKINVVFCIYSTFATDIKKNHVNNIMKIMQQDMKKINSEQEIYEKAFVYSGDNNVRVLSFDQVDNNEIYTLDYYPKTSKLSHLVLAAKMLLDKKRVKDREAGYEEDEIKNQLVLIANQDSPDGEVEKINAANMLSGIDVVWK